MSEPSATSIPTGTDDSRRVIPLRAASEDLRHLAFHGHAEHVRVRFDALTPLERMQHAEPEILRQAARGSLARLQALPVDAEVERRRERDFLESIVGLFVDSSRCRAAFPRPLFQTLLDWVDTLVAASRLEEAAEVCDLAAALGVQAFPDLWPWLRLRQARIQMLRGDAEAAHATLLGTYRRLDRVADRHAQAALLDWLGTTSLATRQAPFFKRLLLERLRLFHTDADERRAVLALMRRTHRGWLRLLASREVPIVDRVLWLTQALSLGAARQIGWRAVARPLEQLAAGGAYLRQYGRLARRRDGIGHRVPSIDATLVTRAMGGLGDFLMMTPGLHALAQRRRPVVLAIPRRFFPLFDGNGDVELVDLDGDLDPAAYAEWFNLTDCPAARVESRTAPNVTTNRIELFARGLGIGGAALARMPRRPRYVIADSERRWRAAFFADHGLGNGPVVGVQPHTDEAYRDLPHMGAVIDAIARDARVIVFGSLPGPAPHPGVVQASGLSLRESFALAGGCDALVAPDSVFFHLAGALDLPCIGLFGPTDGQVRGRDYPKAIVLDARRTLACVPCWRNETIPCGLTGLRPSACLGEIDPAEVAQAVQRSIAGARGPQGGG